MLRVVATANYMQLLVEVDVTWLCRSVCHFQLSSCLFHLIADYRLFQNESYTSSPDVYNAVSKILVNLLGSLEVFMKICAATSWSEGPVSDL